MRDLFENWMMGISYLITDALISFYAFFTTILVEIAFLWAFGFEYSFAFTILLMACIINVLVCSWFKGEYEGCKIERIVSRIYVIVFVLLLAIGLFVDWLAAIVLFVIPIAVTALWIWIRGFQDSVFIGKHPKIILRIADFIHNPIVWVISQIIVIGLPMFMFIYFLYQTPLPIFYKFVIAVLSVFIAPLMAFVEDDWATCNIFELAYDITWSEEYEKTMREFDEKLEKDPEGTKKELVEELEKFKDEIEDIFEKVEEEKSDD